MARIYPDDIANFACVLYQDPSGNFRMAQIDADGRISVRGEDQLFSYADDFRDNNLELNAAAGWDTLTSDEVPAGEVWIITHMTAWDDDNDIDEVYMEFSGPGQTILVCQKLLPLAGEFLEWDGHLYACAGAEFTAVFEGCLAGDNLRFCLAGYKMTLEA